jgi:hypothetical protein
MPRCFITGKICDVARSGKSKGLNVANACGKMEVHEIPESTGAFPALGYS